MIKIPELKLDQLFLIRHADYLNGKGLSEKGIEQIKRITKESILPLMKNESYTVFNVSSIERRAIESSFVAQEEAVSQGKPIGDGAVYTTTVLFGDAYPESAKEFIDFVNNYSLKKACVAFGHQEFVCGFPSLYLKSVFNLNDVPKDFGKGFARGVYIDLKTGEWKKISC